MLHPKTLTGKRNRKRSRWRLERLRAEAPPWSQHPAKFRGHNYCESGDTDFQIATDVMLLTLSKGHVALRMGAFHRSHHPTKLVSIGIALVEI